MSLYFGNIQQGVTPTFTGSPLVLNFTAAASSQDIVLSATVYGWTRTAKPSWTTSLPNSGSTGDTTVSIAVQENTGDERSGNVVYTQDTSGLTVTVTVNQSAP